MTQRPGNSTTLAKLHVPDYLAWMPSIRINPASRQPSYKIINAHELYGLLNSVPIVHSGTLFHQQIPNYFVLHKAELRIPNKPNYVSITCTYSRDYFSLILDLTQNFIQKIAYILVMNSKVLKNCELGFYDKFEFCVRILKCLGLCKKSWIFMP